MSTILICDNGLPFNINTPYESPLGGSETSLCFMVKGFLEIDNKNKIILLNNTNTKTETDRFIHDAFNTINFYKYLNNVDIVIFNRSILGLNTHDLKNHKRNKKYYLYCADAFDVQLTSDYFNKDLINLFDKIICKSKWQLNTYIQYFNIPINKMIHYGNFLDCIKNINNTKRTKDFIFASVPHKGLEVIPRLVMDLRLRLKNNFTFTIISSFDLYRDNKQQSLYNKYLELLSCMNNVFVEPLCNFNDLNYKFLNHKFVIHPHTYHETFCNIFVQSQLHECIPISVNVGSTSEVIYHNNKYNPIVTNGVNIYKRSTYESFIEKIIEFYNYDRENKLEDFRKECRLYCMKWYYLQTSRWFTKELFSE